MTDYRKEILI